MTLERDHSHDRSGPHYRPDKVRWPDSAPAPGRRRMGGDAGVVESYVSYLRKKIDTTEPRLLHTLRGVGYSLRLPRT